MILFDDLSTGKDFVARHTFSRYRVIESCMCLEHSVILVLDAFFFANLLADLFCSELRPRCVLPL